jgi:signal transduction histidine kinase
MPPLETSREPRHLRRDRILLVALILLILSLFLVYVGVTVAAAWTIARRQALARNQATAQLGAQLIDAQFSTALVVLRSLAARPLLLAALRHQPPADENHRPILPLPAHWRSVELHLRDAARLDPDIALAAVYRPDGRLVTSYPHRSTLARSARDEPWFGGCRRQTGPYISPICSFESGVSGQGVYLVVPVGPEARPVAYLMAPVGLEEINRWLQPLDLGAGEVLYVADPTGRVVAASSGGEINRQAALATYPPVYRALTGHLGTTEIYSPVLQQKALVGYAPSHTPRWAVIATQPLRAALAAADELLWHLSLLVVPVLALMIGAGALIEWLYTCQARLAHQNAALSRDMAAQNERLRAADQAKSEFLGNVSHQLRTPLASMKAAVSGLLEPDMEIAWDQDSLRGFLTVVNDEIDRLTAQVRNLLHMTRIEAHALPLKKERCDLTDIVGAALERVQPLTRGWTIEADFPSEPLLIEADYAQIETVILNLLENAVKYAPPGTRLSLRGETRRLAPPDDVSHAAPGSNGRGETGRILFLLRDEGPGVNPGDEERIFEKFYRSPHSPSTLGTGLGLAICKAIITAHGGSIGVRSAPGGGAEFWLRLPGLPLAEIGSEEAARERVA